LHPGSVERLPFAALRATWESAESGGAITARTPAAVDGWAFALGMTSSLPPQIASATTTPVMPAAIAFGLSTATFAARAAGGAGEERSKAMWHRRRQARDPLVGFTSFGGGISP
jgi:hypothetical protein